MHLDSELEALLVNLRFWENQHQIQSAMGVNILNDNNLADL